MELEETNLREALLVLVNKLKNDEDYRRSWKDNIAMAYKDNEDWYIQQTGKKNLTKEDRHIIANNAAEYFLKLLCDHN